MPSALLTTAIIVGLAAAGAAGFGQATPREHAAISPLLASASGKASSTAPFKAHDPQEPAPRAKPRPQQPPAPQQPPPQQQERVGFMTAHAFGQRPVFTANVEVVRLPVAVFDSNGAPVPDLGIEDFALFEDGVAQEIRLVLTPNDAPLDVAFVLDFSSSISNFADSPKDDAVAFLDALSSRDCVVVLPFRSEVGRGIWGSADDPRLRDFIEEGEFHGGTALHAAILRGLEMLQRAGERNEAAPGLPSTACGILEDDLAPMTHEAELEDHP